MLGSCNVNSFEQHSEHLFCNVFVGTFGTLLCTVIVYCVLVSCSRVPLLIYIVIM